MATKIVALYRNKTWHLVPLPAHGKIVGSKWVYKLKLKADGSIDHYKAHLVAQGFSQTTSLDYSETFSLIVKSITIRIVLTLVVAHSWCVRQLNVQNVFLHCDISKDVFMT